MIKKIFHFIFLVILVSLSSCSLFQSETDNVVDLLPRDSDVPGWIRINSVLYYKGKEIKKYNREYNGLEIDKLAVCSYQSIDDDNIKIKLEVIKFESVLNAYGFFSTKRGPGIFETAAVNEYYSNTVSIIQIGEYAIYSTSENSELQLKKDLKTFVNIPALYIGQNYNHDRLPDFLNVIKGVDGYGVLYSIKPYHMLPSLARICFTQWTLNNEMVDIFLNENKSFYDAYEIFKKNIDNSYIIISSDNIYTAFKREQDGKYSFISVTDRWIFGCWSINDMNEGKKILNEIRSRIEDYKNREVK